jgi:hypothetical protein
MYKCHGGDHSKWSNWWSFNPKSTQKIPASMYSIFLSYDFTMFLNLGLCQGISQYVTIKIGWLDRTNKRIRAGFSGATIITFFSPYWRYRPQPPIRWRGASTFVFSFPVYSRRYEQLVFQTRSCPDGGGPKALMVMWKFVNPMNTYEH